MLTLVEGGVASPGGLREVDWSILMARAQDGDVVAYRRLLEEIAPYLRSLTAKWFRSADEIEDAMQDALLTIHAIRHTYDPARPFGPWLAAVAKRRFIDRIRRSRRRSARETPLTAEHETFPATPANSVSEMVERHDLGWGAVAAAGRTAPGDRVAEAEGDVVEGGRGDNGSVGCRPQGRDPSRAEGAAQAAGRSGRRPMTPTPVLIDRLVAAATPVRRLRRPTVRAASWLLIAAAVIGLLIAGQGIRPDFERCLRDMNFVASMMGMVLTGICAAVAAFMLSLPDRARAWVLLPLPAWRYGSRRWATSA